MIQIPEFLRRLPGGGKAVLALLLVFFVGYLMGGGSDGSGGAAAPAPGGSAHKQLYTCSMHPRIRLEDPNARCPICGMELIPVKGDSGDDDGGPRRISMSEGAKLLAEVRTTPVERLKVIKQVRLVGKIGYDETRLRTITAWVPGRLDRLYVDYTGVAVRKGAPMVWLYSPELLVAQEALLKSDRAYRDMRRSEASANNLEMQAGTVKALEDRLRLWGLTDEQIKKIRKRGTASDHMTILSPISGIVIRKTMVEGDYVRIGHKIYEIADLSRVWVYLDAYESDLAWIKYAQQVEFEAEAYPGEVFRGRISFIDPFLNETTRTVKVRVTVDNVDGRLKPGMFVRGRIHARLADGGHIVEPSLAGKWISPNHPEIILDKPGNCPICGTPLVSTESLGYVGADARPPLVIPATAALLTGTRAIVYVRVPDTDRPTFEGREIELGPRTRNHYLVRGGLKEGELVVTNGAFKIDSALQILAKPSMMSPPEKDQQASLEIPASIRDSLSPLYQSAVAAQRALADDDREQAQEALAAVAAAADSDVDMGGFAGPAHDRWMTLRARLIEHARTGSQAADITAVRVAFDEVSKAILETVRAFGQATGAELYEAQCPMAFEQRGATWLAASKEILNPYFGEQMLDCGSVQATFVSRDRGPRVRAAFRHGLTPFWDALLGVHRALVNDDLSAAKQGAAVATRALDAVTEKPGPDWLGGIWLELGSRATSASGALANAVDLAQARASYERLNGVALALLRRFGHARTTALREAFCPMAFDNRGAFWIQEGEEIKNPYYGQSMPGCGEIRQTFEPVSKRVVPKAFREGLSRLLDSYLEIGAALSRDDLKQALAPAATMEETLSSLSAAGLEPHALERWRKHSGALREAAANLGRATDLEAVRRLFALSSDSIADALARFGHTGPDDLVELHCPMAFGNRGANWIQRGKQVRNPYFGAAMLRHGDVVRSLPIEPKD